jgi:hypothetical protein
MSSTQQTSLDKLRIKYAHVELLKTSQVKEILQTSSRTIGRLVKAKKLTKYFVPTTGTKQAPRYDKEEVFGLIKTAFIE